jgi:ATP-dependent Clp protease protease subunit
MTELIIELKSCEKKELDRVEKQKKIFKDYTDKLSADDKKLFILNEKETEIQPIKLTINSFGGTVYDVLFAVDQIKSLKVPVNTIVCGTAASAATILSLAGKKRFITKHSQMLIHEVRTGWWGKKTELSDEFDNIIKLSELLVEYYAENTKMTREELPKILERDRFWNATECLQKGLVDEII